MNKPTDQEIQDKKKSIIKISLVLILLAITAMLSRHLYLLDDIPIEDSVWQLSINARFISTENGANITLAPPIDTRFIRVVAQHLVHPRLAIVRQKNKQLENKRVINFMSEKKGKYEFTADFTLHIKLDAFQGITDPASTVPMSSSKIESYLIDEDDLQVENPAVQEKITQLSTGVSDLWVLINNILTYTHEKIISDTTQKQNSVLVAIKTGKASTLGRARFMIALSRAAKIPARLVTGFIIEETVEAKPYYWVQLYYKDEWIIFDPEKLYQTELPPNYVPLIRGNNKIITATNIKNLEVDYEVSQIVDARGFYTQKDKQWIDIINLERLPLESKQSLIILMLLPLGALFTSIVRSLVGVRTYGTFTPTLIGLAAMSANWITAIMIFTIVAVMGLSGRHFINGKLLRAPRLSIVFTLVALAMTLGISMLDYFNLNVTGGSVLLPIVILTTLVDRIYTTADDDGIHTAFVRLVWTLAVAIVCLAILQLEWLGNLILQYPESHLITLALILLLSTYTGKKFLHLIPLKWLDEPTQKKSKKQAKNDSSL